MRSRTPLSLRRLSPVELGLGVTILLLFLTVMALVVVSFAAANMARSAFEGGYVMTDLAAIQRSIYRLHLSTHEVVQEDEPDWERLHIDRDMLGELLTAAGDQSPVGPDLGSGLARLDNILRDYDQALIELVQRDRPSAPSSPGDQLHRILVRLEREAQRLSGQQEQRFFGRISAALDHQRRSQGMLLLTITTLLVFSVGLAVLLRHSLNQEFERAYAMIEALYGADEELHRHQRPQDVFQSLVDLMVELFGADRSVLFVWNRSRRRLEPVSACGYAQIDLSQILSAVNGSLVDEAARSRKPVMVEDTLRDDRVQGGLVAQDGVRALMHVPFSLDGPRYGVLSVCFDRPRTFDADDLRMVRALANRASSAIENARLYQQIQASATADERQRLARELHDAVTQTLFSASLIAEVLPRIYQRSPEQARERLDELRELTRGALAEMRTLLLELRPAALTEARLSDLLEQLGEASTGRARVPITVTIEGDRDCDLPAEAKVAMYRVAQESLNNLSKHAHATRASVVLCCCPARVELTIEDDGQGFDPETVTPDHLGLGIMRERAAAIGAALEVTSAPGEGARIHLVWTRPGTPSAPTGARLMGVPGRAETLSTQSESGV